METAIISVRGLDLWYGGFHALKGITMDIPERRITALIGPSGCGKSTLLRCINRMNDEIPGVRIGGSLTYHGQEIYDPQRDVTVLRKNIGMVFQKPAPFPMSIYDIIYFFLSR